MRILIDGRMFRGRMHGLARYVYCTLEAMARLRPDWEFAVLEREGAFAGLGLRNVEPVPVQSDPFSLGEFSEIPRVVREQRAALFHAPSLALPPGVPGQVVATVPDLTPLHFPRRGFESLYFRWVLGPILRKARRILVYSEHTRGDVATHLHVPEERVAVTGLGVDPELGVPRSAEEVARVRERLDLPPRYVLCLANPKPHKNVGLLLEAWRRAEPEAQLLLACPRAPWLEEELRDLPSVRRADHLPEEDLPAVYQGATALVIPSLYEGFGLPAAEAMAAGTAVLAARAASLPEVVGEDGLLFDPRSPDSLAEALLRILRDEDLRLDLSRRGRARAARWTWEETARRHLEAYRESVRK